MDVNQWADLIQELRDAIQNAKASQDRLTTNNTEYTKAINDGFELIQDTIHEIDDLIIQITDLIAGLKSQIGEFEATNQQTPRLTAEIEQLQTQLNAAKAIQRDAVAAMQDSIVALNANNEAMQTSTKVQDVDGLNKTIMATTTSLEDIKTRLQALLNQIPNSVPINNTLQVNPMGQQNYPLPDDTEFELPESDGNITYGDLKRTVNNKITQITDKYGKEQVPDYLTKIYNTINAVNVTQEEIQMAIDKMPFDAKGQLQGGKRKRRSKNKTTKKRKMRQNNTIKKKIKQKKGYRYTLTKRGIKYKTSKKRSIARL
jgi:chromosome segregation ATPase